MSRPTAIWLYNCSQHSNNKMLYPIQIRGKKFLHPLKAGTRQGSSFRRVGVGLQLMCSSSKNRSISRISLLVNHRKRLICSSSHISNFHSNSGYCRFLEARFASLSLSLQPASEYGREKENRGSKFERQTRINRTRASLSSQPPARAPTDTILLVAARYGRVQLNAVLLTPLNIDHSKGQPSTSELRMVS